VAAANLRTVVTPSPPDPNTAKIEALTAAIASLGEMFKSVIQNQVGAKPRNMGAAAAGTNAAGGSVCNFCGIGGHFI